MTTRFHTPYVNGETRFKMSDMNPSLAELDSAITDLNALAYDIGGTYEAKPGASLTLMKFKMVRTVTYQAGMPSSQMVAGVAATAQTIFSIKKNGVEFATATFSAAGTTATVTSATETIFSAGDTISIVAPASPDATLASLGWAIAGIRAAITVTSTSTTTTTTTTTTTSGGGPTGNVYYVDFSDINASDSNAGTSPSLPWKFCPGMLGWSGSASLIATDTVYFKNSTTWTNSSSSTFLEATGGVTFDGKTWGSGTRAVFRALTSNTSASRPGIINIGQDDEFIDTKIVGFELDGNGKYMSGVTINWPSSTGSLEGATKLIEDNVIHNFGDPGGTVFGIYGIKVGALSDYVTRDIEIYNNTIYDTPRSGIAIYDALSSGTHEISNVLIKGNTVYNAGQGGSVRGEGILLKDEVYDIVIEYNYLHSNDGRGVFLEDGSGRPGPTDITIRYNIITDNDLGGIALAQPAAKSFEAYGNLIFQNNNLGSGGSGLYFESNLSAAISAKVYNNTFFENANGEILITSAASFSTFEFKNNICYSLSTMKPYTDQAGGSVTAHTTNIYYRPGGGTLVSDGGYYTAANLTTWEASGLSSDPVFNDSLTVPTGFINLTTYPEPDTDGLNITSGSPAENAATSLASTYNNSVNSVTRPSGAAWDIGAYEYEA